jgi:tRNA-modifying protein YgfZ
MTFDDRSPEAVEAAAAAAMTLLRLEGRDAPDLLHRISTAFLTDLAPGEARATLFCDFRGRLLHRAIVGMTSDHVVWLLRDDAPPEALAAHLDRHIFREDVRVRDAGPGRTVIRRSTPVREGPALLEHDFIPTLVRVDATSAFEIVPEGSGGQDPAREQRRILAGAPRHGHEIAEAFTPFEVGLAHEVHLSKGCFTGQEALMRLVTYQSVRRRLVRVDGRGDAPATPTDVRLGGERVGVLTSAVAHANTAKPAESGADPPEPGGWIGLAVLKHEACEPNAVLALESGAELASIRPFPLTHPLGLP